MWGQELEGFGALNPYTCIDPFKGTLIDPLKGRGCQLEGFGAQLWGQRSIEPKQSRPEAVGTAQTRFRILFNIAYCHIT